MENEKVKSKNQIKDFKIALKDMELWVKNPNFLWNGRDINNFSLIPREAWANWLLCVVYRELHGDDITFIEDEKGDGIIFDKKTNQQIAIEHVCAMDVPLRKKDLPKGEARIINAINHKIKKGDTYAEGKYLLVFFDGAGKYYRNKIREAVNGRHNFKLIYCIGLLECGENGYTYSVTELHKNHSITFKVQVNSDFSDWEVSLI